MFRNTCRPAAIWVAASLLTLTALTTAADDDDHERARVLRESARVLPLAEVLERVGRRVPGRLLEAELEEHQGGFVYELEIIGTDGVVREVLVDAANGALLSAEQDD